MKETPAFNFPVVFKWSKLDNLIEDKTLNPG